ncbi:hypothetical protein ABZ615_37005 [Streptomyces sp. NPDC007325]|uniref:hypothetical protein n=1 Tax=unclassified Streptomyces TaxID=2593676 RepID=UPI0034096F83
MREHPGGEASEPAAGCRSRLTDEEFRTLMREARSLARRGILGRPPPDETDFALRARHAEFGAAVH